MFEAHFDILNYLGMTHKCDWPTDTLSANATLQYIMQPKKLQD